MNHHSSGGIRLRRLLTVGFVLTVVLAGLPAWPGAPGGVTAAAMTGSDSVDLNSASLEEVLALPMPAELARRLVDYRTFVRFFDNVYDLMDIEGMTPELFKTLKPLVSTMPPPPQDASIARLSASYRQVQRYLGQEGSSEGLVDEYLDKMRNPENINSMDLYDLMSYQMVSPVDATNILKARARLGRFESSRQLRGSDGLRYYSYRNLRDFVVYDAEDLSSSVGHNKVSGYAQIRFYETPYSNDDDELGSFASGQPRGRYYLDQKQLYQPGWLNKVRVNVDGGYVAVSTVSRNGTRPPRVLSASTTNILVISVSRAFTWAIFAWPMAWVWSWTTPITSTSARPVSVSTSGCWVSTAT